MSLLRSSSRGPVHFWTHTLPLSFFDATSDKTFTLSNFQNFAKSMDESMLARL